MSILNFQHVSLALAPQKKLILDDVSFEVKLGETLILLGTNGSGKSSLLKLIQGQHRPSKGKIYFTGTPLKECKQQAEKIKLITQDTTESVFMQLTIFENFLMIAPHITHKTCHDYLQQFNHRIARKLDSLAANLSGGERQTLALALAVYFTPKLLLLDEHTSALDPKTSARIMDLTAHIIRTKNISCILTTHDLDIAQTYGDRIMVLNNGQRQALLQHEEIRKLNKQALLAYYY